MEPKALLQSLEKAGAKKFVLTDINNTSACLDTVRMAQNMELEPVLGIDFRNSAWQCYVGIAKNNQGFKELNTHLSEYLHEKTPFEERAPEFENAYVVYPFSAVKNLGWINDLRSNEFIGVTPRDLNLLKFTFSRQKTENELTSLQVDKSGSRTNHTHRKLLIENREQKTANREPRTPNPELRTPNFEPRTPNSKFVLLQTTTFRNKRDFNAHRLLRAIDNNCLLSKLPKSEEGHPKDVLRSVEELRKTYAEFPWIIENTEALLDQCEIHFDFGSEHPHKNLKVYSNSEEEDYKLIRKLAMEGLPYRYPNPTQEVLDRIEKELHIIKEKNFISYFLINWDITSYARSKGYFYVGRGSGANSVIAYLLRITDVDPIDLDLYFERFINLYRQNPPDFDIDFSWTDRDDVTRYIFERFPHVTLLAVYNTFQYKAVVRELGKVFGLPKHEIDLLTSGRFQVSRLDQMSQLVLKYSTLIQGFPNHLSVHACGILITEESIHTFCGTFLPPKGYPTTQIDMVIAEDAGLHKFDILSQRGLGKIKDTLEIVRYNRPLETSIDIHDIQRFKEDEGIKHMLRNAEAIGCFYVESPAMRMLLRKLQVDDYLGLVAASSVIRPGVAKSGMMRTYIQRFRFPEKRKDAHPVMLEIMPDTYGVMVYQEDVIKVAHYFAGLDLGEADVLRREMSGKFRSREEFNKAKDAFFTKAHAKGYSAEMVAEVWRQVESFAGYAFAKGHSASYAVESYQSLFLKTYYPLEYMVATINNSGGFYSTEFYVHEARMHGADIQPPCVNRSSAETLIFDKSIFLGFGMIKALNHEAIKSILIARNDEGEFTSLHDFSERTGLSLEQVSLLIRVGAFRFTGEGKKELLWQAHLSIHKKPKASAPLKLALESKPKEYKIPKLYTAHLEDAFDHLELLGFPLCHPFKLLKHGVKGHVLSKDLVHCEGKKVTVVGYVVTIKTTKTANGKAMYFGTFIDEQGDWLDSVHFPPVAAKYPFRGKGIYLVYGKVTQEFGCYQIEAEFLDKLPIVPDPRYDDARTTTQMQIFSKQSKKARQLNS